MNAPDMPIPADPGQPPQGRALIERQPGVPIPAPPALPPGYEEESDSDGLDLRELWQVVLKRRWTIIVFAVIVVVAAVTATYLMTPIYRASLILQIDREDIKVTKIEEVAPVDASTGGQDYLQTQYELLKSRSLAQRVIDQMGLADQPAEAPSPSMMEQVTAWLAGWLPSGGVSREADAAGALDAAADGNRIEGVITGFLGGLTVEPVRNSRLVRLHYNSPDPKLAAAILNNLAKSYINLNLERRFDATTYARNFLQERLQQVKAKLEESERELVDLSRREEIISVDQKESVITGNLTAASAALIEAGKQRMGAESVYRQMLATRGQGLTQVLESKIIQDLKQTKAKLEAQYQENLSTYKPAYPTMLQLRGQIKQVDAMINEEVGNIRAAITSNYEAAKAEESMLRTNLDKMKQEVLSLQGRSIPLNILRREADTNRQLYDGLLQRYKEVGVAAGVGTNNISVVDEAKVPAFAYKPSLRQNALLALVLGLLGGVGLAFLFEHLDDTFRRPEELERLLDLPLLGVIPKTPLESGDDRAIALIGHDDPRSAFAEAYRSVRTALQFSTASGVPRLLTVTSAMTGEGKSTSALSLAIQFAQAGKQTLLIEGDLRKPSIHRSLRLENQAGLTNYLAGGEAQPVEITRPTHIPNLFAIPSGPLPPNPAELLSSARMVELLALAAEKFDQVIVDSPPLLGLADALIIGNLCEGTLLTIEMASTPRGYVQGAVKRLRGARVPLLGTILTKLDARAGAYGYYRSYYYYYHHSGYYGDTGSATAKRLPE
ncbi:polysaccharide biosynthesis tyrosine autokinase [uncultured Lamprocystis sp.]|jgi:capsular exopolysaccharide synthesis family protein|uniref:GumC family protein n=1 Tax=uncultured Lamprocystis sp. TaxID=543132 RepID=UPI0025F7F6C1|nr:polysaccharide biosynthesis tyrosine autokinase [uncultured Lamprocystis sp.]